MAYEFLWTISIIAQVDENNEWEYNNFRKTIEWQANVENLRYVIFEYHQNKETAKVWELSHNAPLFQDITLPDDEKLFEGIKSLPVAVLQVVEKNQEDHTNKEDILVRFFKRYVLKQEAKSKYQMLITWGHGAGLGYFYHDLTTDTKTRNNLPKDLIDNKKIEDNRLNQRRFNRRYVQYNHLSAHISKKLSEDKVKNFCYGKKPNETDKYFAEQDYFEHDKQDEFERRNKFLTAEEFAQVITNGFGKKMVNVYIANNCWTNMFETGYALRKCVEVYVASQSIVPFAGVDYRRLFKKMEKNPELDTQELARNITDSFLHKYTSGNFAKAFKKKRPDMNARQFSISVNKLKNYDAIFDVINQLAKILQEKLKDPDYFKKIDIARSYCGDFAQGVGFIDFTNFLCELIKGFQGENPPELKALYKRFFFLKEDTLLSIVNPGDLFRLMPNYFYSQSPQLFSIFFPARFRRSDVIQQFITDYLDEMGKSSSIWKGWEWINFLKVYHGIPTEKKLTQQ